MKALLILLLTASAALGTSYTEFYTQTTGDNLNAGAPASTDTGAVDDAAAWTYAGGTFVRATGVFTVASGNPSSDGVAVGDWVSIYTTAGASVANCVARVTARNTTTITISATPALAVGAVANVSETAAAATAKVGGAWKGPNAASGFPFNAILSTGVNASGNTPCVNMKGGTDYQITAAMTHSTTGSIRFEGYTSTAHDGGRAVIADVTTTASYVMLTTTSAAGTDFVGLTFDGAVFSSGASDGITTVAGQTWLRCVAHDLRRSGFTAGGTMVECEAYACNKNNNAGIGGFQVGTGTLIRCISHDHTTANGAGFIITSSAPLIGCIADTCAGGGYVSSGQYPTLINCEAYNNTGAGLNCSSASITEFIVINCNFIKNSTYGINSSGSLLTRNGIIYNCGFGTGTQANGTADIVSGLMGVNVSGSISYASNVTPWVDPANGDFDINLAAAKNAGRGSFTQTAASYAGTLGFPDIGASPQVPTAGGGETSSASAQ